MSNVTITRMSALTGVVNTQTLPLSAEEFANRVLSWKDGALIQDAFPMLTADEREFIKTGITSDEWDKYTKGEEDWANG